MTVGISINLKSFEERETVRETDRQRDRQTERQISRYILFLLPMSISDVAASCNSTIPMVTAESGTGG